MVFAGYNIIHTELTGTSLSVNFIHSNCPAFRGTVPIFGPKFPAVPLFLTVLLGTSWQSLFTGLDYWTHL